MSAYVDKLMQDLKAKNPAEPEFHQRPEQEQTSRSATTRQYGGQPAGPPWSGLPTAPSTGYGYPY